jgi:hypothetical protein
LRAHRQAAGTATRHVAAYFWAGPNTLIGLALAGVMLLFSARARRVNGVVEVTGGRIGDLLASPLLGCPFRAVTLGHVILGTDDASLDCARSHEQVHVRQYERWGPAFLPAYFASSAWQLLCGRRCYLDNWFEREARDRAG